MWFANGYDATLERADDGTRGERGSAMPAQPVMRAVLLKTSRSAAVNYKLVSIRVFKIVLPGVSSLVLPLYPSFPDSLPHFWKFSIRLRRLRSTILYISIDIYTIVHTFANAPIARVSKGKNERIRRTPNRT
ncbi:hypothetical protein [Collinsella vaginalis]|uniref:hypothetical protein n=1 Tax=Collinsella vaginalis TaxID=1870987 RepID=UPI001C4EF83F|nr:hypothetical protein [Collinsella vaginalis]